jgi:hypothetical protein
MARDAGIGELHCALIGHSGGGVGRAYGGGFGLKVLAEAIGHIDVPTAMVVARTHSHKYGLEVATTVLAS